MIDNVIPCYVYAVKSTVDVHGSIGDQVSACTAGIEATPLERTLAGVFCEENESGYSKSRGPALAAVIAAAVAAAEQHGKAELWAWRPDRFSRGSGDGPMAARHLGELWFELRRKDVFLRSAELDEQLKTASAAASAGDASTSFSSALAKAVRGGARRRVKERGLPHGKTPYGVVIGRYEYDSEIKRPVGIREWDAERCGWVHGMAERYAAGSTVTELARWLNDSHVATPHKAPLWRGEMVRDLLGNTIYFNGKFRYGDEFFDSGLSPIIEPDLAAAVKARREALAASPGKGRGRPAKHSLNLLASRGGGPRLVCGCCGLTMQTTWARGDSTYRCASSSAGARCVMPTWRRRDVDEPLLAALQSRYLDLDASAAELAAHSEADLAAMQGEIRQAARAVAQAEKRLDRVRRDYQDALLTTGDWVEQRSQLTGELELARARAAELSLQAKMLAGLPEARADALAGLVASLDRVRSATAVSQAGRDVQAVRASLLTLFTHVTLAPVSKPVRNELGLALERQARSVPLGDFVLELSPRAEALEPLTLIEPLVITDEGAIRPDSVTIGAVKPTIYRHGPRWNAGLYRAKPQSRPSTT